jgi:hypothetical protein
MNHFRRRTKHRERNQTCFPRESYRNLYVLTMNHANSYPESDRMVALGRRKGHPASNPREHAPREAGFEQQSVTVLAATRANQRRGS